MAVQMVRRGYVPEIFFDCCKVAELPSTRRQWKKWQKGKGKACLYKAEIETRRNAENKSRNASNLGV